jgi:hypothetical protein
VVVLELNSVPGVSYCPDWPEFRYVRNPITSHGECKDRISLGLFFVI